MSLSALQSRSKQLGAGTLRDCACIELAFKMVAFSTTHVISKISHGC